MEISNLIPHIEALIFASDKPLAPVEITELVNSAFGFMEDKIEVAQIETALEGIVEKYASEFYPFEVRQSGGGWQFLTKKEFHKTVAQLNGEKFLKRLSAAALETLAIVAYKQPVTKGEIESIRGVSTDYAMQKLLEKELIVITGRNEKMPGHPLIYATSKNFMDYFGINSADDLPKIKEVLANTMIEPTVVQRTNFEESEILAVANTGQLILSLEEDESLPVEIKTSINGHDLGLNEDDLNEDETAEEVTEEFISDEIFIEGDEVETAKELLEENGEQQNFSEEISLDENPENNEGGNAEDAELTDDDAKQ